VLSASSAVEFSVFTLRLNGGTGIIALSNDAAFWVLGGHIYAVNDKAREIDPSLETAPPEITYDKVRAIAD